MKNQLIYYAARANFRNGDLEQDLEFDREQDLDFDRDLDLERDLAGLGCCTIINAP